MSRRTEPARDNSVKAFIAELGRILERHGLHGALAALNARTRHRFTGVYRFDPPILRNAGLFDRENPDLLLGADTPMRETYCSIVGERERPFSTDDAGNDPRISAHPARSSVLAYCGVPLITADGSCVGSLCHFDLRPRIAPMPELPVLERAAPLILRALVAQGVFPGLERGSARPARGDHRQILANDEPDERAR